MINNDAIEKQKSAGSENNDLVAPKNKHLLKVAAVHLLAKNIDFSCTILVHKYVHILNFIYKKHLNIKSSQNLQKEKKGA